MNAAAPQGVAAFRFYHHDSASEVSQAAKPSVGIVTAPVGYTQLQGLAARARRFRGEGLSDDDVSKKLGLAPGQIQGLLAAATKMKNAAAEREATGGLMLTHGDREAARENAVKAAAKFHNKGAESRIFNRLAKGGPKTIAELRDELSIGTDTIRRSLKALEAAGAVASAFDEEKRRRGPGSKRWRAVMERGRA